ncbi:hypothetical protein R1sor_021958 [Riccia sorocarpa]|uniref:Uncharacterized protein n=1 Tax=Riccia sorocarpa TaxID=122646 RepID=A0ABD3GKF5_9MARC
MKCTNMWRKKFHVVNHRPSSGSDDEETAASTVRDADLDMKLSARMAQKANGANGIMQLSSSVPAGVVVIEVTKSADVEEIIHDSGAQCDSSAGQQKSTSVGRTCSGSELPCSSSEPQIVAHKDGAHWHYSHRSPWLRALVLGANDGLVSISSLMLGVGAVKSDVKAMVISGLAGLVAGAGSMAIGEFVSVFSQRDTEMADLEKERREHAKGPEAQASELEELAQIYVGRGLPYYLAKQVAEELTKVDALKAHARDELGIDIDDLSNPMQAALASAMAFSLGGGVPLLAGAFISSLKTRIIVVVTASSVALATFGAVGARLGGAPMWKAALRVLLGGWLAMGLTYGILRLLGSAGYQ